MTVATTETVQPYFSSPLINNLSIHAGKRFGVFDPPDSWESGAMQTPRMWQKHCSIVVPPLPFLLKTTFFCHGFPEFPSKYCNFPRFRSQRARLYQTTTKILITLLPLQFSTVRKHYEALHIVNPLFLPLRTRHWDLFQH